jgi:hypothetical protein
MPRRSGNIRPTFGHTSAAKTAVVITEPSRGRPSQHSVLDSPPLGVRTRRLPRRTRLTVLRLDAPAALSCHAGAREACYSESGRQGGNIDSSGGKTDDRFAEWRTAASVVNTAQNRLVLRNGVHSERHPTKAEMSGSGM